MAFVLNDPNFLADLQARFGGVPFAPLGVTPDNPIKNVATGFVSKKRGIPVPVDNVFVADDTIRVKHSKANRFLADELAKAQPGQPLSLAVTPVNLERADLLGKLIKDSGNTTVTPEMIDLAKQYQLANDAGFVKDSKHTSFGDKLKGFIAPVAGAVGFVLSGGNPVVAGLASGAATGATGGSIKDVLINAGLTFAGGSVLKPVPGNSIIANTSQAINELGPAAGGSLVGGAGGALKGGTLQDALLGAGLGFAGGSLAAPSNLDPNALGGAGGVLNTVSQGINDVGQGVFNFLDPIIPDSIRTPGGAGGINDFSGNLRIDPNAVIDSDLAAKLNDVGLNVAAGAPASTIGQAIIDSGVLNVPGLTGAQTIDQGGLVAGGLNVPSVTNTLNSADKFISDNPGLFGGATTLAGLGAAGKTLLDGGNKLSDLAKGLFGDSSGGFGSLFDAAATAAPIALAANEANKINEINLDASAGNASINDGRVAFDSRINQIRNETIANTRNQLARLSGNEDAIIKASVDPLRRKLALARGDIERNLGRRNVHGSIANDQLASFNIDAGRALGNQQALALANSIASQDALNARLAGQGNALLSQDLAGLQLSDQAIGRLLERARLRGDLQGRLLDVLGRAVGPDTTTKLV